MANASETGDKSSKKVQEIAKGFLVIGDEMLAHRIQNEEYSKKHGFNREERQMARQDVPLAIRAHTEEELRLQKENMERLERLKKLAEEDAILARQLQENETATLKRRSKRSEARPAEMVTVCATIDFGDDGEMARLVQEREVLEAQKSRVEQEIRDQELAVELHNREMRKYLGLVANGNAYDVIDDGGRAFPGRSSKSRTNESKNQINEGKLGGKVISLSEFGGFKVSDEVPEEERRMLIKLQDEELARALQMSEEMKAAKMRQTTSSNPSERRDAEMARLMQRAEDMSIKDCPRDRKGRMSHEGEYLSPACCGCCRRQVPICNCQNLGNERRIRTQMSLPDVPRTDCRQVDEPFYSTPMFENEYINFSRQGTRREHTKTQSFFQRPDKK